MRIEVAGAVWTVFGRGQAFQFVGGFLSVCFWVGEQLGDAASVFGDE